MPRCGSSLDEHRHMGLAPIDPSSGLKVPRLASMDTGAASKDVGPSAEDLGTITRVTVPRLATGIGISSSTSMDLGSSTGVSDLAFLDLGLASIDPDRTRPQPGDDAKSTGASIGIPVPKSIIFGPSADV